MSQRLNFRARALDVNRPMPLIRSEETPDVLNDSAMNRGVVQLPTGMEKEEEGEVHIAEVIRQSNANPMQELAVIPAPETTTVTDKVQRKGFKLPKQYIRTQLWEIEDEDCANYDMDSEDESWLTDYRAVKANTKHPITEVVFEKLMGKLETASAMGPPAKVSELAGSLEVDQHACKAVYAYHGKRLTTGGGITLTPLLKIEALDGSSARDAYVAFRRRTERMHTRKNQKTTESSYVNMVKLQRDLHRCREILELVKRRETVKRDVLKADVSLYQQRFALRDWDGEMLRKCKPLIMPQEPQLIFRLPVPGFPRPVHLEPGPAVDDVPGKIKVRKKTMYKRKRDDDPMSSVKQQKNRKKIAEETGEEYASDLEEELTSAWTDSDYDEDDEYRLRRRNNMFYHAPLLDCPTRTSRVGQYTLAKYRAGVARPAKIPGLRGFCRRRVGRGGRIFIDRCRPDYDFMDELTMLTPEQEKDMAEQQQRLREMRERYLEKVEKDKEKRRRVIAQQQAVAGAGSPEGSNDNRHAGLRTGLLSQPSNPYAKSYERSARGAAGPVAGAIPSSAELGQSGVFGASPAHQSWSTSLARLIKGSGESEHFGAAEQAQMVASTSMTPTSPRAAQWQAGSTALGASGAGAVPTPAPAPALAPGDGSTTAPASVPVPIMAPASVPTLVANGNLGAAPP